MEIPTIIINNSVCIEVTCRCLIELLCMLLITSTAIYQAARKT